jgi:transcription initiation factor TFIIIB Brf1 subunit/transcription initiation factor TFIIB
MPRNYRTRILEYIHSKNVGEFIEKIAESLLNDLYSQTEHFLQGQSSLIIAQALIYISYRKAKMPKPLRVIAEMCDADATETRRMFQAYKRIRRTLGMKFCESASILSPNCILLISPEDFINDVCVKLGLSQETISYAHELHKISKPISSSPVALAGAIIYLASDIKEKRKVTQAEIASCLSTTEVSVRNAMHKFCLSNPEFPQYKYDYNKEKGLEHLNLRKAKNI